MSKKTFAAAAESGNDLLVRVKGNQPSLEQALADLCVSRAPLDRHETVDRKRHGRQEHRRVEVFDASGRLDAEWQPLVRCVARISRLTWCKNTRTGLWDKRTETAYYACQRSLSAAAFAQAVRAHWGIENRNHYVRDGVLGEDASRIRCRPGIFARFRSFALNILRANRITNVSQALFENALSLDRLLDLGSNQQN